MTLFQKETQYSKVQPIDHLITRIVEAKLCKINLNFKP